MSDEIIKKKRGRPPGKFRRAEHKWDPKVWEPTYDVIVMMSITKSNKEIAEYFRYSPQTISNVLTSPTGLAKKAELLQLGRDKLANTMETRARQLTDLAMSRLHTILCDEEKMQKPVVAFGAIDRAIDIGKTFMPELNRKLNVPSERGITVIAGDVNQTQINNNADKQQVIFSKEQSKEISDGLEKLKEIRLLHAS